MKDYYKILGVREQATDGEIKAAYRKLVKTYHPDVVKDDKEKEARMYEIQEAYQCLGETEKQAYDEKRKKGHAGVNAGKSERNEFQNRGRQEPDMSRFEAFFGFQPGKGMETYHDKRGYARRSVGPIRPEEMFASFFGKMGSRGGKPQG